MKKNPVKSARRQPTGARPMAMIPMNGLEDGNEYLVFPDFENRSVAVYQKVEAKGAAMSCGSSLPTNSHTWNHWIELLSQFVDWNGEIVK